MSESPKYISVLERCLQIIREQDSALQIGQQILYEKFPKQMRVMWVNLETLQEWSIGFNTLGALVRQSRNDPRTRYISAFITGHLNASQSLEYVNKLENIKAFW